MLKVNESIFSVLLYIWKEQTMDQRSVKNGRIRRFFCPDFFWHSDWIKKFTLNFLVTLAAGKCGPKKSKYGSLLHSIM